MQGQERCAARGGVNRAGGTGNGRREWPRGGRLAQARDRCAPQRLKALEDENARLKKVVADLTLDREMLQDVIRRKLVCQWA